MQERLEPAGGLNVVGKKFGARRENANEERVKGIPTSGLPTFLSKVKLTAMRSETDAWI